MACLVALLDLRVRLISGAVGVPLALRLLREPHALLLFHGRLRRPLRLRIQSNERRLQIKWGWGEILSNVRHTNRIELQ
jgi:hypothetical protein